MKFRFGLTFLLLNRVKNSYRSNMNWLSLCKPNDRACVYVSMCHTIEMKQTNNFLCTIFNSEKLIFCVLLKCLLPFRRSQLVTILKSDIFSSIPVLTIQHVNVCI